MSADLDQKKGANLSAEELYAAYEWRLIKDAKASIEAGKGIEVTPFFFDDLRQTCKIASHRVYDADLIPKD